MDLRDFLVRPFGRATGLVPDQSTLDSDTHYTPGERAVFFAVIDRTESEIVMAEDDKHLTFWVSVLRRQDEGAGERSLFVTTAVRFHSVWGRVYFTVVKPFHFIIVRRGLTNFINGMERERVSSG